MVTSKKCMLRRLPNRVAVFSAIVFLALFFDQITKQYALRNFSQEIPQIIIPRVLSFRLLRNPGASLGLGSGYTWLISLIAIAACITFFTLVCVTNSVQWTIALSFAFAGAAGNLIDRFVYARGFLDGQVIDFLDYGWSVGNIADIYLSGAAILVIILILLGRPLKMPDDAQKARTSGVFKEQGR